VSLTSTQTRIAFVALAVLGLAACTAKEKSATPDAQAVQAGNPVAPAVVTVHAKDYMFDAPTQIGAGVTTFKLVNDGQTFHHMVIIRLDSGKTVTDLQAALKNPGPPPAWAITMGGPNAPDPTKESNATLDLEAGNYALICFVDLPENKPHFMRGMVHALTVTPATGPAAAAPKADIALTLKDYGFDFSAPVTAGTHTFEVKNAGPQPHEVELLKLAPGKKLDDLMKWMDGMKGPPPASGMGGAVLGAPGGKSVYFTADFTPGDYALLCFITDSKDKKPHFLHGMSHAFTVN
jgi:hypothetical protein